MDDSLLSKNTTQTPQLSIVEIAIVGYKPGYNNQKHIRVIILYIHNNKIFTILFFLVLQTTDIDSHS
jgi:hypothetical protein